MGLGVGICEISFPQCSGSMNGSKRFTALGTMYAVRAPFFFKILLPRMDYIADSDSFLRELKGEVISKGSPGGKRASIMSWDYLWS